MFREWIPENSVQAVHIYFPDPWWKRRQAKYRLLTPELIQNLEKRLQARGTFCFATDIQDYFTRVLEMMKNFPNFEKAFERHYSPEDAENPNRSNFETKMRLKGRWIFEAHWVNWLGESITS
ncbi:tRNA (guanine-N(7)-)-methyltransferase [bacterium BMS3Abin05]|nr:tRNA (guanine-N(7)-)-methyltransferase [bacterium BMS3Abin05]